MMHILRTVSKWLVIGAVAALSVSQVTQADESSDITEIWKIAQGGLLYDNWAKVMYKTAPDATHPLYPSVGKKKGPGTWRCKECHGWDYRGADGAYAKGSHFTGIKGIRDAVGKPVSEIKAVIRGSEHGYTDGMIPDAALENLALFVSSGQLDMTQHIDYVTKTARGDTVHGARLYQTICAVCHGFDGKTINFKTPPKAEYIGTVASANPQETLHKILNGQPGVPMVALRALDIQDLLDILAYAQTLPEK